MSVVIDYSSSINIGCRQMKNQNDVEKREVILNYVSDEIANEADSDSVNDKVSVATTESKYEFNRTEFSRAAVRHYNRLSVLNRDNSHTRKQKSGGANSANTSSLPVPIRSAAAI